MLRETLKFGSSQFCLSCGFCCDGMLHTYTSIHPNEVALVRSLGLAVAPRRGALGFKQPCRLYKKHRCSKYPFRPSACKDYQCALLRNYLAGELRAETGAKIIQRARELTTALMDQLPPGYSLNQLRIAWDHEWDSGQGMFGSDELRQANASVLLTLAKLHRYLKRHFIKPKLN